MSGHYAIRLGLGIIQGQMPHSDRPRAGSSSELVYPSPLTSIPRRIEVLDFHPSTESTKQKHTELIGTSLEHHSILEKLGICEGSLDRSVTPISESDGGWRLNTSQPIQKGTKEKTWTIDIVHLPPRIIRIVDDWQVR